MFDRDWQRGVGHDEDGHRVVFGPVDASGPPDDLHELSLGYLPSDSLSNGVRVPIALGWPECAVGHLPSCRGLGIPSLMPLDSDAGERLGHLLDFDGEGAVRPMTIRASTPLRSGPGPQWSLPSTALWWANSTLRGSRPIPGSDFSISCWTTTRTRPSTGRSSATWNGGVSSTFCLIGKPRRRRHGWEIRPPRPVGAFLYLGLLNSNYPETLNEAQRDWGGHDQLRKVGPLAPERRVSDVTVLAALLLTEPVA